MSRPAPFTFYEFFAGGGMARIGLGPDWHCLLANDLSPAKVEAYRSNWGDEHLHEGDVWALTAQDLPGRPDLAWASSPCQDLSLAGGRAGLAGQRSSAFWGFWHLMEALDDQNRAPKVIVIENVVGLLSSGGGRDFAAVCEALAGRGYDYGAVEINAAHFLPQSRPRMFLIAARRGVAASASSSCPGPMHGTSTVQAARRLSPALATHWRWWTLPSPPSRTLDLADLLEGDDHVPWHSPVQTEGLIGLMAPLHRDRLAQFVQDAQADGQRRIGALFRRTRQEEGRSRQRAEARFDGLAGCLRTARGGSSRQSLLVIDPAWHSAPVRSRLLSPREAARIMGLSDGYRLPSRAAAALNLLGDGVAAPVVAYLEHNLLRPLVQLSRVQADQ